MYGGRISLAVGFIATAVALLIGVTWGAIAGYAGGRVDAVMMRLVDIIYALPFMIFIVLLMVVFGRNMLLLFLAIGAVEWLTMARIMRAQVQSLRQQEFVEAAISLGLSPATIIRRHLVPNALGPIIVYTTLTIPSVMLLEAFLSFPGPGRPTAANFLGSADLLRCRNHGRVSLAAAISGHRTDPDPVFPKFSRRRTARCAGRTRRQGLTTCCTVEHLSVSFVTRMGTTRRWTISASPWSRENHGYHRRIGLGQIGRLLQPAGPYSQPPGRIDGGSALFQGQDLLQLTEAAATGNPRSRHRPDLPGPHDLPQPIHDGGQSADGAPALPPESLKGAGPQAGAGTAGARSAFVIPPQPSTTTHTSSPAACASG